MTSLGQKLRGVRRERKLTQASLGQGIVSASMISQIEAGHLAPSQDLLEKLARRLNVEVSYFHDDSWLKSKELAIYRRAKSLLDAGRYAEAVLYLESLLNTGASRSLAPETSLYFDIALCYLKLERYDEAVKTYEQCLQISLSKQDDSGAIYSYYYLGHLYLRLNNLRSARMYWQRARAMQDSHALLPHPVALKVYLGLARVNAKLMQYASAEQDYLRAEKLASQSESWLLAAEIYAELADTHQHLGNLQIAELYLERARALYSFVHHQSGMHSTTVQGAIVKQQKGEHRTVVIELSVLLTTLKGNQEEMEDWPLQAWVYMTLAHSQAALGWHAEAWASVTHLHDLLSRCENDSFLIQHLFLTVKLHLLEKRTDIALQRLAEVRAIPYCQSSPRLQLQILSIEQKIYRINNSRKEAVEKARQVASLILRNRVLDPLHTRAPNQLSLPTTVETVERSPMFDFPIGTTKKYVANDNL